MNILVMRCPNCGAPVIPAMTVCGYCDSHLVLEKPEAETPATEKPAQAPKTPLVGDIVSVEFNGTWYQAVIREIGSKGYFIHYEGWGDDWDEWVAEDRIRRLKTDFEQGDVIEVKWGQSWYVATVKKVDDAARWFIHYQGWGDDWDEWVTADRIRELQ